MELLHRAAAVIAVAPLMVHGFLGIFSRYIADDYCSVSTLRRFGFWGSQQYWYSNFYGRFSMTFTVNLLELLGPRVVPVLPIFTMFFWLLGLTVALRSAFRGLGWALSLAFAGSILFVTLGASPNVYQSLYWQTGMVTYTLPIVILTLVAAIALWGSRASQPGIPRPFLLAAVFVFSFIAGGFSETTLSMQIVGFALVTLVLVGIPGHSRRTDLAALGAVGLLGSLVALAVVLPAPGNEIRMGMLEQPSTWAELVLWTMRDTRLFILRSLSGNRLASVFSVVGPFLIGLQFSSGSPIVGDVSLRSVLGALSNSVLLVVFAGAMIVASIAPSLYGTANYPADRVLIVPQYVLTLGLALASFHGGRIANAITMLAREGLWKKLYLPLGLLLILIVPVWVESRGPLMTLPQAQTYARLWDERHQSLLRSSSQPNQTIEAVSLPHMGGLAEIGYDPDEWINICLAESYDLKAVIAK